MKSSLRLRTAPLKLAMAVLVACLPSARAQAPKPNKKHAVALDPGSIVESTYRNSSFSFSYKVPYGWVDRTADMSGGAEAGKSMVLLSVFERPPEASGDGVNSAVVIAAESVASYPGMKTAADYFDPLTELTTSKGFKVVEEPFAVAIGSRQMARSDFSKEMGPLTMYQASLVMLAKGYAVSFTFLGGSKEEVDGLAAGLSFAPSLNLKPAK